MSLLIAMFLFSLAMSLSPGPVNIITLSTGLNHGFRKTLPFISGATVGFTLLLAATGLGIAQILSGQPQLMTTLGYGGAIFLVYMGYKIATSDGVTTTDKREPAGFWDGALLQWLNPKAWAACIAGVSAFNLAGSSRTLMLFVLIYFLVCYVSIAAWGYAGAKTRILSASPKVTKLINITMGGGLILLAIYLQLLQSDISITSTSTLNPALAQGGKPTPCAALIERC